MLIQTEFLKRGLQQHKDSIITELQKTPDQGEARVILAAWEYALDTMAQQASSKKTCSWHVEGADDVDKGDYGDGNITLRRV